MSTQQLWQKMTEFHVRDVAVSRAFYHGLFGLDVIIEEKHRLGFQLPQGAVLFVSSSIPGEESRSPLFGLGAVHDFGHVCVAIAEASLDQWGRYLMVNGIAVEYSVNPSHGGTSYLCRDPDGHSFELATWGPPLPAEVSGN